MKTYALVAMHDGTELVIVRDADAADWSFFTFAATGSGRTIVDALNAVEGRS